MYLRDFKVWAERSITTALGSIGFVVVNEDRSELAVWNNPVPEIITIEDRSVVREVQYSFQLPMEISQGFMDALWALGLRPTDHSDFAPIGEAKDKHIAFAEGVAQQLLDSLHPYPLDIDDPE